MRIRARIRLWQRTAAPPTRPSVVTLPPFSIDRVGHRVRDGCVRMKGAAMNRRRFVILSLVLTLIPLCPGLSQAATRARNRAETVLNDPLVRLAAGIEHSCQVKDDGAVPCGGKNFSRQPGDGTRTNSPVSPPVLVSGVSSAVAVSVGNSHTCALIV